jgi:hypothetical protein
MFGKWSVILRIADDETVYSLVSGEHPEAVFTGSKKQCLKYIRNMSGVELLQHGCHCNVTAQNFPESFFLIGMPMYYYPTNTNTSQREPILARTSRWFNSQQETVDY